MRTTAAVLAALIMLTACSDANEEPEPPPEGPLEVVEGTGCELAPDGLIVSTHTITNDAEIALTIDEVALVDPVNVELVEAVDEHGEALVDATLGATDEPGNTQTLRLHVRLTGAGRDAGWTAVEVLYHNVEGEFRDVGGGEALTGGHCPR